jgi:hypothetical protein
LNNPALNAGLLQGIVSALRRYRKVTAKVFTTALLSLSFLFTTGCITSGPNPRTTQVIGCTTEEQKELQLESNTAQLQEELRLANERARLAEEKAELEKTKREFAEERLKQQGQETEETDVEETDATQGGS